MTRNLLVLIAVGTLVSCSRPLGEASQGTAAITASGKTAVRAKRIVADPRAPVSLPVTKARAIEIAEAEFRSRSFGNLADWEVHVFEPALTENYWTVIFIQAKGDVDPDSHVLMKIYTFDAHCEVVGR